MRARGERYVAMNMLPKSRLDVKAALRSLPPGTDGERRDQRGQAFGHVTFSYGQKGLPAPRLPAGNIPVNARIAVVKNAA